MLVDARDEAEYPNFTPGANRLLLPQILLQGVYFIVSTREKAEYHLLVDHRRDFCLVDNDPHNLDDVRQYIFEKFGRQYRYARESKELKKILENQVLKTR